MRLYHVFQYGPVTDNPEDERYIFTTTPVYCVPGGDAAPTDGGAANFAFERIKPYESRPLVIQCQYIN